jgi:hypothetical protein
MKNFRTVLLLVGLVFAASSTALAAEAWRPLFNGRNLEGWEMFLAAPDAAWEVPGLKRDAAGKYLEPIGLNRDPLHVFSIETVDGAPAIHISGQGFGVITTKELFANFRLRLQVKWGERKWGYKSNAPRDSGLLYFVHGAPGFDHGTWPRSIEFQIQEHDIGDLYALGTQITVAARREGKLWQYDPVGVPTLFVQKLPVGNRCVKLVDAEKPNGEWNTLELICFEGDSIHVVNGEVVMRLHDAQRLDGPNPTALRSGQISLQTEGAEVYFRDVKMVPIEAIPEAYLAPHR